MGRFRFLLVVVLYFTESATSRVCSQELHSSPCAVIFMNGSLDQKFQAELKRARYARLEQSPPEDSLKGYGVFDWLLQHYPAFKFCRGNAHFSTTDGKFAVCTFITIPDQAAFDSFVEFQRSNRRRDGSARIIDEGDGKVRIVASPDSVVQNGTIVNSTYGDLHYRYSHGLLCYGRKQVFDMNMVDVVRLIPEATDHDAYWRFVPGEMTVATRGLYLDAVQAGMNLRMQKFDVESVEAHEVRKTALKIQSLFLDGLFDDIEDITVILQRPKESEPYRIRCHAKIREASPLAKFVAGLNASRPMSVEFPKSSVAKCCIHMGLPAELKDFLRAIVHFEGSNSILRDAFLPTIDEGIFTAQTCLYNDDRGEPLLQVTSPVAVESQSVAEMMVSLSSLLELTPDLELLAPFSDLNQVPILCDYRLSSEIKEQNLIMTVANQSRVEGNAQEKNVDSGGVDSDNVVTMNGVSLINLEWDFSPWIVTEPESPARNVVNAFERLYFQSEVDNHPTIRIMKYIPPATYKPLLSEVQGDGDWSGSASVRVSENGNAVVMDFRAGVDLFHVWKARIILNEQARKSIRGL